MKKTISVILAIVMIVSAFSVSAYALTGDANSDNKITAVDARMILQYVAGLNSDVNVENYDINGDGKITAIDARVVLQIVAGLAEHPAEIAVQRQNLETFVAAFNAVKTDASSVTLVSTTTYKCEETKVAPAISAFMSKEQIDESLAGSYGTEELNETYTGEDIAAAFPPTSTTCTLTMDDIKSIKVTEGPKFYSCTVVVKGETNPVRGKGVGAVATIITRDDLDAMIAETEMQGYVTMDAIYNDVTIKADIDKETGKIVSYTADSPLVLSTDMLGSFAFSIGLGIIENWTITY